MGAERAAIPGLDEVDDDSCYRAMDFLLAVEAELAEAVYWATADLLNLEVDLPFFDTTACRALVGGALAPGRSR